MTKYPPDSLLEGLERNHRVEILVSFLCYKINSMAHPLVQEGQRGTPASPSPGLIASLLVSLTLSLLRGMSLGCLLPIGEHPNWNEVLVS